MHAKRARSRRVTSGFALMVFGALGSAQAAHSAEILDCTAWPNASLRHRGPVTIDAETLTWRADTAAATAAAIRQDGHFAACPGDAPVYLVFGSVVFDTDLTVSPLTVRRVLFVKDDPPVSKIACR